MMYSYRLTFPIYKQAVRCVIRANRVKLLRWHLQVWGLMVIGATLWVMFAHLNNRWPGAVPLFLEVPVVAGLLLGGFLGSINRLVQLRRNYRALFQQGRETGFMLVRVEGTLLILGDPQTQELRIARPGIYGVAEDDAIFAVLTGKSRFVFIDKRQVPPSCMQEVRAWLAQPVTGSAAPPQPGSDGPIAPPGMQVA